jgi:hypothetical protein
MAEKIEAFWVNATADDVARVMAGEAVEARFRDDGHSEYTAGLLAGWTKGDPSWLFCDLDHGHSYFEHCQVYREPSWWTDKPDPGPGYRLLEKFPDEPVTVGDEFFKSGKWYKTCRPAGDSQDRTGWYRRRLKSVEPVEHYVGKAEAIKQFIVGDTFWHPNGLLLKITEKGFEVTQ